VARARPDLAEARSKFVDMPPAELESFIDEAVAAVRKDHMPTPAKFLEGKKSDPGVTNVRNATLPRWRRWLGVESRCVVPFNSFAEPDNGTFGGRAPVWFAFGDTRPLTCFASIWTRWTAVRKGKEGETTNDIFAFLTINPNANIEAFHPKAMPVILRTPEEVDTWLTAPTAEALKLQRPLPDGSTLRIVSHGTKEDGGARAAVLPSGTCGACQLARRMRLMSASRRFGPRFMYCRNGVSVPSNDGCCLCWTTTFFVTSA
jgi:putative SOS response-associated peptidase YedK